MLYPERASCYTGMAIMALAVILFLALPLGSRKKKRREEKNLKLV